MTSSSPPGTARRDGAAPGWGDLADAAPVVDAVLGMEHLTDRVAWNSPHDP